MKNTAIYLQYINDLVIAGKSFREAYQEIGGQVQDGSYTPSASKKHTHLGSKDNLGLDGIRRKVDEI